MAAKVHHWIAVQSPEADRAQQLEQLGFQAMDALHLACAESAHADIFVTTDDKLLKLATRLSAKLQVTVVNPVFWLLENL
jgi:predicted nucleic acid-binding protein